MTCWLKVLLHPIMFRPKHEMLSMVHREMERNEFQLTACPVLCRGSLAATSWKQPCKQTGFTRVSGSRGQVPRRSSNPQGECMSSCLSLGSKWPHLLLKGREWTFESSQADAESTFSRFKCLGEWLSCVPGSTKGQSLD